MAWATFGSRAPRSSAEARLVAMGVVPRFSASPDEAQALLTQAFLIEVVDRIEHEGAREVVREWLTARL